MARLGGVLPRVPVRGVVAAQRLAALLAGSEVDPSRADGHAGLALADLGLPDVVDGGEMGAEGFGHGGSSISSPGVRAAVIGRAPLAHNGGQTIGSGAESVPSPVAEPGSPQIPEKRATEIHVRPPEENANRHERPPGVRSARPERVTVSRSASQARASAPPRRRDALVLSLVCLALYLALFPRGFYGGDSVNFYMMLGLGITRGAIHELYLPMASAMCALVQPFGGSRFLAMALLSAIGVAASVFVLHRAAALSGLDRKGCATVALAVGLCPAALQFATEIEVNGPALFGASLAWWAAQRFLLRPSVTRAAAVGLATGLAASMHSAAQLLTLAVALFALGERPELFARWRRLPAWAGAAAASHLAVWFTCSRLFGAHDVAPGSDPLHYFAARVPMLGHLEVLPGIAWRELLLPWFPLWCMLVAAWFAHDQRRRAAAATLIVALYLLFCHVMLGPELLAAGLRLQEQGVYFLPIGFVLALLTARLVRSYWRMAVLGVLLANALWLRHPGHEAVPVGAPEVQDVVALIDDRPGVLIVRDPAVSAAILLAAPDMRVLMVETVREWAISRQDWFAQFDRVWAGLRKAGASIWFSDASIRRLEADQDGLVDHLRTTYRLVREELGSFVAWRVDAR